MSIFKYCNLENQPCIVCGSTSFHHHYTVNNDRIIRCNECGLLFVAKIEKADLESFYEYTYFNSISTDLVGYKDYTTTYEADRFNYVRLSKLLARYINNGRKLLDVGCAYGYFVKTMNELGWEAKGIDPSEYAIKESLSLNREVIQQATIEEYKSDGMQFNVITLIGVLEHLGRPLDGLKKINDMLNPGGVLLLTTLNAGRYIHLFKFKPPEHLFYFTYPQLTRLLQKTGFTILRKRLYFRSYRLSVFLHQVNSIILPWMTRYCDVFFKKFPKLDIIARFPTNEMLIIAKKV